MALLVSRMRGMAGGTCRQVLPSLQIGSTANEMTGSNVIRRPHSRKKNQCVMNRQPSTSISGKHRPENYGRGSRPSPPLALISLHTIVRMRRLTSDRKGSAAMAKTRQPDSNSTSLMAVYEHRALLNLEHSVSCRGIGSGGGR